MIDQPLRDLIAIDDELPNGYKITNYEGEYVLAVSPTGHQYVTWHCFQRKETKEIITIWGNYFICDLYGGEQEARRLANEDLEQRAEKRRKQSRS
mgnify:CR=1 FL=1